MQRSERSAQARRELDRKFAASELEPLRARPRSGWIAAVRGALGMSQAVLADRLGISGPAVNRLEHAEVQGGITIAKLDQVARALDCTLVYGLVPNSTLEETVLAQATSEATALLGYAARTMALEDQGIDDDHQGEAVDRYARELVAKGNVWRTTGARPGR